MPPDYLQLISDSTVTAGAFSTSTDSFSAQMPCILTPIVAPIYTPMSHPDGIARTTMATTNGLLVIATGLPDWPIPTLQISIVDGVGINRLPS